MGYRTSRKDEILEKLGTATQGISERVPEPIRKQWDALPTSRKWIAGIVLPLFVIYFLFFIVPSLLPDTSSPPPRPPENQEELAATKASHDDYAVLKAMDAATLKAEIAKREAALELVRKTQKGDDAAQAAALEAIERARDVQVTGPGG